MVVIEIKKQNTFIAKEVYESIKNKLEKHNLNCYSKSSFIYQWGTLKKKRILFPDIYEEWGRISYNPSEYKMKIISNNLIFSTYLIEIKEEFKDFDFTIVIIETF